MTKSMNLIALVAMLLISATIAQNIGDLSADVNVFSSASVTLQNFASVEAATELSLRLSITPTAEQLATFRTTVLDNANVALIESLRNSTSASITQLVLVRAALQAAVTSSLAQSAAFKAAVIGNLTNYHSQWQGYISNVSSEVATCTDSVNFNLAARVRAVLLVDTLKIAQRLLAASVVRYKSFGELMELNFRAALAGVWVINNTIASVNNSNVGGITWTAVSLDTVKEEIVKLGVAQMVAQWRIDLASSFEGMSQTLYATASADVALRVQNISNGFYANVAQVKAKWNAAADSADKLGDRAVDLLQNVSGMAVAFQGLDLTYNISVTLTFTRERTGTETIDAAKQNVARLLQILLIAVTGMTESEVSVTATATTSVKRTSDAYMANSQLGNSNTVLPPAPVSAPANADAPSDMAATSDETVPTPDSSAFSVATSLVSVLFPGLFVYFS